MSKSESENALATKLILEKGLQSVIEEGIKADAAKAVQGQQISVEEENKVKELEAARDTYSTYLEREEKAQKEAAESSPDSEQSVSSNKELQSPAVSDRSGIQDLITEVKKAGNFQEASQAFQAQYSKPNPNMKPFETFGEVKKDEQGNTITTFVTPGLSAEDSKNPENHVTYTVSPDGKLSIDAGKKVSCILPPQVKEDGKGFDMVKIENGQPSSLAKAGAGKSTENLSIGGKKVDIDKIPLSSDVIRANAASQSKGAIKISDQPKASVTPAVGKQGAAAGQAI